MSLPVSVQVNHTFMEESLDKGMGVALKNAELVARHVEGDNKAALLKRIESTMLDICLLNSRFDSFKNVARDTVAQNNETVKIVPIFERALEEASVATPNPKDHPYYKRLKEQIRIATAAPTPSTSATGGDGEDDDMEIAITASEVNTIDPFTMRQMVDPVKNKKCGHVYDKDSVENMLKKKHSIRCPVVGCVVTSFSKKHLVPDEEMRRILLSSQ